MLNAIDNVFFDKSVSHSDITRFGVDGTTHMSQFLPGLSSGDIVNSSSLNRALNNHLSIEALNNEYVLVYSDNLDDVCPLYIVNKLTGDLLFNNKDFKPITRFNHSFFKDKFIYHLNSIGYWVDDLYYSPVNKLI